MVGSSPPGPAPFLFGGGLKDKKPKRLSCVHEEHHVHARLFFTVIGPGAWQLAEDIADTANEIYPTLQSKHRWSRIESDSDVNIDLAKVEDDLAEGINDDPPFHLKVWLQDDELQAKEQGSRWADARDTAEEHEHNGVFAFMKTLSTASKSTHSLGSITDSVRKSLSRVSVAAEHHVEKQVASISYFAVEKDSDEVKDCRSAARWKHSCVLFLLDPSQEDNDEDMLEKLTRRRLEVQTWVMSNLQRHGLCGAPPLIAVVLINGTSSQEYHSQESQRSESLESKGDATGDITTDDKGPSESDKYLSFVEAVRSMFNTPEGECIHHFVNFDDPSEVLRCHVKLAANIVDARQKHAARSLLKDERPDDGTTKQASCCRCSVM